MSFPRFFIDEHDISDGTLILKGDSAAHIAYSLRMKSGETIIACDGKGREYVCVLKSFTDKEVESQITDIRSCASESLYRPVIVQACPKGDKADTVVMKSVELGACGIVFFVSSRSIVRYTAADLEKKRARWQRIALESAKQSGRGTVPEVRVLPDSRAAAGFVSDTYSFFCYEDEDEVSLKKAFAGISDKKGGKIAFIIGPEGGFTKEEAELFTGAGAVSVSLGKRILRTETVSSFVLSCLSYETEM